MDRMQPLEHVVSALAKLIRPDCTISGLAGPPGESCYVEVRRPDAPDLVVRIHGIEGDRVDVGFGSAGLLEVLIFGRERSDWESELRRVLEAVLLGSYCETQWYNVDDLVCAEGTLVWGATNERFGSSPSRWRRVTSSRKVLYAACDQG